MKDLRDVIIERDSARRGFQITGTMYTYTTPKLLNDEPVEVEEISFFIDDRELQKTVFNNRVIE